MFRLLSHIFHWEYEPCKGCDVLKQQLAIANTEKAQLTETLLSMLKPQVIELPVKHTDQVKPALGIFARRREELERKDREQARAMASSGFIAKPDSEASQLRSPIEALEKELDITNAG